MYPDETTVGLPLAAFRAWSCLLIVALFLMVPSQSVSVESVPPVLQSFGRSGGAPSLCTELDCNSCSARPECGFCIYSDGQTACQQKHQNADGIFIERVCDRGELVPRDSCWKYEADSGCSLHTTYNDCYEAGCKYCLEGNQCIDSNLECSLVAERAKNVTKEYGCNKIKNCADCLSSPLGCWYCSLNGCMASSMKGESDGSDDNRCESGILSMSVEGCPGTNLDKSNLLTPFACTIVLLAFLISLL